jgi:hypothetical protein
VVIEEGPKEVVTGDTSTLWLDVVDWLAVLVEEEVVLHVGMVDVVVVSFLLALLLPELIQSSQVIPPERSEESSAAVTSLGIDDLGCRAEAVEKTVSKPTHSVAEKSEECMLTTCQGKSEPSE